MRLKELREEKGVSQEELARAISSDPRSISRWELEQNAPTLPFVIALAKYFDCSLDFLAGLTDEFGHSVPSDLSDKERKILKLFGSLTESEQDKLIADAEFYARRSPGIFGAGQKLG